MTYTKTVWKDRIVEKPLTYTLQNNGDGTTTLIPSEGAVTEAGTPITASNLNKIENQVETMDQTAVRRSGDTMTGKLTVSDGGLLVNNGYLEVGTYNDTTYGTGKAQLYYDGLLKRMNMFAKDGADLAVNPIFNVYGLQENGVNLSDKYAQISAQLKKLTADDGTAISINGTDLNALDITGFYRGHTLTNAPTAASSAYYFFIIHTKHDANSQSQTAIRYSTGSTSGMTYQRVKLTGTWQEWVQIATYDATGKVATANLPSASTTAVGISQLNDTITSTSTTQAATANSVKLVTDEAQMHKLTYDDGVAINYTGDVNALTTTGRYYVGTSIGTMPPGLASMNGLVVVDRLTSSNGYFQEYTTGTSTKRYVRYYTGGAWGAWKEYVGLSTSSPIVPALLNGWVNFGGYQPVTYFKDELGWVHLTGLVKSGTMATAIFTLPVGYRPALERRFATVSNATSTPSAINIGSDGGVVASLGGNTWFSLEGFSFKAEV